VYQEQATPAPAAPGAEMALPKRATTWQNILKFIKRKPLGAFGLFIIGVMVIMTLGTPTGKVGVPSLPNAPLGFEMGTPWLSRYGAEDKFYMADGRLSRFEGPSANHWFGTDNAGRDIWSRVVHGTRRSLFVGVWALGVATVAGASIGIFSGYFRGWVDTSTQRIMDSLQSFPPLIALILIVTINPLTSGPSLTMIAIALGLVGIPGVQRITRGVVLSTREQQYVEAARVIGATDLRTMVFYILPNITASIIIVVSTGLGVVILAEAALSFIVPRAVPQDPSWGLMLNHGRPFMFDHPWMAVWACTFITLAVLAFNLAGDALRDVLDPRLRT
jgi:peptide/nickel transport system permease protein